MMSPTDYFLLFLALCPIFFSIIAPTLHSYTFWTRSHFLYHRIGGFIWLFHYALAWYVFLYDYEMYRSSILSMSVPISGVFQIITALYYFRFLPRTKSDPGLYGDKGILTYTFVQENLFFALIQVFGAIYHSHMGYSYIRSYDIVNMITSIQTSHDVTLQQWMDVMISVIVTVVECVFVFLPFQLIRRFFPKTSFTAAFNNRDQNTTKENREFYTYSTYVIKIFYMAAKHLMAGEILYIRFMDRFDIKQQYWLNFMLICSGGTLYVAVFMHTLRFKKIINPVHGYGIYLLYWLLTMLPLYHLRATLFAYPIITSLVMIALSLNFTRRPWLQGAYQWMLVGLFYAHRYQYLQLL